MKTEMRSNSKMDETTLFWILLLSIGISQYSESLYIAAPANITVSERNSTSLEISWHPVNAQILGYRIRYHLNATFDIHDDWSCSGNSTNCSNLSSIYVCRNKTSVCLTDLRVFSYYWIEVIAFTNGTFGNDSINKFIRTDEGAPNQPPWNVTTAVHNSTTISISWEAVPEEHRNGIIIGYIVNVIKVDGPDHEYHDYAYNSSAVLNLTISDGLEKFTKYKITVSAKTSKGLSPESYTIQVQTAEDAPEAAPTEFNFTGVTVDSLVVTWKPVEEKLNGILRAYKIKWKAVNSGQKYIIQTLNVDSSSPSRKRRDTSGVTASNVTSFKLTNLTINTNYSVQVAAFTIKDGLYSNPVYVLSGEGVPTSSPGNVTAYNTSSTSIYVEWSPPDDSTIPGLLVSYEVAFTPASLNASVTRRLMLCACNTSVELRNLTIYTLYNITVAAFTKVGIGTESPIRHIRTDEDVPVAAPRNVTAVSKTFNSIHVTWDKVLEKQRHGIIIKYQVKVLQGTWNKTSVYSKNYTDPDIRGLQMMETYQVQVRAYTRIGPGPYSLPAINVTTIEEAPTVIPTNVTAIPISSTAIRVKWDIEAPEIGFKLKGFVVVYRALETCHEANAKEQPVSECDTVANLSSLCIFTTYEITVAARTENLTGNSSQPINVTTREGVPQAPPANVWAVPESVSSIRVYWSLVPEPDRNGNITGYNIELRNSSSWMRNISIHGGDNLTAVIDNLDMFVTYSFKVQASTKEGSGPFSSSFNQKTNQTVPEVVLNVTAHATGNSSIHVTWNVKRIHPRLKQPSLFQVSYTYCQKRSPSCNEHLASKWVTLILDLKNLLIFVEYTIRVRAENITAEDGTEVRFPTGNYSMAYATTLEGVPQAPPSSVKAEAESTTSIKVSWDKVPWKWRNGKIIRYSLEVYNGSSQQKVLNQTVDGNKTSYVVEGLQVYSNYSVQVRAETKLGSGPFSNKTYATTHQPAPNVVPQNVKATSTNATTIFVTWEHVENRGIIGFQGYRIKFEVDENSSVKYVDVSSNANMATLTKLKPFTKYKIEVAARSTQEGNYSDPQLVKTEEGVPTAAPSNLYSKILDSTSARINWGPVPEEHRNGIILGYRIFYRRDGNDTEHVKEMAEAANSVLLLSLDKAANYHVRLLAFTVAGEGTTSKTTFKTDDDIPSQPPVELKTASKVSPHRIEVSWKPVPSEFLHGTLQNYEVTYKPVMVGEMKKEEEPLKNMMVDGNHTSVVLEDLEPYVRYEISVGARTAKGLGPSDYVLGETCNCESRLTTSWRRYEPYVDVTDNGRPGQIIPQVLQSMVQDCCGECQEFDNHKTVLDFTKDGNGKTSGKNTSRTLLEGIDVQTDFTFPVHGNSFQDSYKGGYGYLSVIESAGVAFIVYPEVSTTQTTMFNSMLRCLPVMLLPILTAYVAGVIMWALERSINSKDFNPSFIHGTKEGIWWAFVSMTTLGYGDRAPLSYKGRLFAMAWIYFGLIVISVTMAMLTTALTTVTLKSASTLYGSKIAAEKNSPEYHLGMRRNAKYDPDKEYYHLEEITEALINREVEGILVDTYSAGLRGDLFNRPDIEVSKILDYSTAYGVVLSPNSTRLRECFKRYLNSHRAELFEMIKKKVKPIETSKATTTQPVEETSGGLLDSKSPTFNKALRYACGALGVVLFFSLIYEVTRRIRSREKVHQKVHLKTIMQREMGILVEEFQARMHKIKKDVGEKHRKQIIQFWKQKRKDSSESEWLRISQVSPQHSKELIITDLY